MIKQVDQSNFQETIQNNEIVLVDFYAEWCGPCKSLHPTLEALAEDFDGRAIISKVNVDSSPELSEQFGVRSIPALFYFKNGQVVGKQNGVQNKSTLSSNLEKLISN